MSASIYRDLCDVLARTSKPSLLGALHDSSKGLDKRRVRILVTRIDQAISAYHEARKRHIAAKRSGYDAKRFAKACGAQLESLLALIDSRFTSRGGVTSIGWSPDTQFAIRARADLYPILQTWRDRARAEAAAAVPDTRLANTARRRLEAELAESLHALGVTPTSASTGVFARILRDVLYPRVGVDAGPNHLGPSLAWWRQTRRAQIRACVADRPRQRKPRTMPTPN